MEHISHSDLGLLAGITARNIAGYRPAGPIKVFAIPRGGIPAAYAIMLFEPRIQLVSEPAAADLFIDDIVDSGRTMMHWCDRYPGRPFFALIDKTEGFSPYRESWVVFPWEKTAKHEDDSIVGTIRNRIIANGAPYFANDNIAAFIVDDGERELLQAEVERRAEHFLRGLLIDVDNDHNTKGTAKRMAKMYLREVFKGRYQEAPTITDFPNAKGLDEMYVVGPITIRSSCSHHLAPIIGQCWIGIVPGDRVIGLSKFNRIVDWFASRPQIQEELSMQIADFIEQQIKPRGLAVIIRATHLCMTWRGVKEPMAAEMKNSIMRGVFRDKPETRAEFMALVANK